MLLHRRVVVAVEVDRADVAAGLRGDEPVEVVLPAGTDALRGRRVDVGLLEGQRGDAVVPPPATGRGATAPRRRGRSPGARAAGRTRGSPCPRAPSHPRRSSRTPRVPDAGSPVKVPIQRARRSDSVTAAQTSSIGARNSRVIGEHPAVALGGDRAGGLDVHAVSSCWSCGARSCVRRSRRSRVVRRTSVSRASRAGASRRGAARSVESARRAALPPGRAPRRPARSGARAAIGRPHQPGLGEEAQVLADGGARDRVPGGQVHHPGRARPPTSAAATGVPGRRARRRCPPANGNQWIPIANRGPLTGSRRRLRATYSGGRDSSARASRRTHHRGSRRTRGTQAAAPRGPQRRDPDRAQARVDQDQGEDGPGVQAPAEPGEVRGTAHGVPGGRLPQHLRVLGGPRGDLPHRRRPVHPALRLLPDRHRQAAAAGPRRAPPGRRVGAEDGAALRHHHRRRPRRPARRRRLAVRRDGASRSTSSTRAPAWRT